MKRSTPIYKIPNTSNNRLHIALHLRAICSLNFTTYKRRLLHSTKTFLPPTI